MPWFPKQNWYLGTLKSFNIPMQRSCHGCTDKTEKTEQKEFFCVPQQKKNTQNKGELFSFFEIFTTKFSHFLVTKKLFFATKKWLNSAVKILKNEKSSPFFWVFFCGGGHKIKGLAMATVAFSHFYKIHLVPKVTKFTFYNISSSLLTLSSHKCFW